MFPAVLIMLSIGWLIGRSRRDDMFQPKVKLIFNKAEMEALSRGYGKLRYYGGSGEPIPEGRIHYARDFYLPKLSPVYTPKSGVWDHWGISNKDGSLDMGYVGVLNGDDGVQYRFIHIAVKDRNAGLRKGQRVDGGTFLGTTSAHNLGKSESHLHVDARRDGEMIDPASVLSVDEFNRMTHGFPNRNVS